MGQEDILMRGSRRGGWGGVGKRLYPNLRIQTMQGKAEVGSCGTGRDNAK